MRPSYGLAEATVWAATGTWGDSSTVHFDVGELSAGRAQRCAAGTGTALVKYKVPQSPTLRIVDCDTNRECPQGLVGEIWIHGANVAEGYWRKPPEEQRCFGATLVDPSPGTPDGPWLRTGDLGFISEGELFIVGRIKDLLIIRGRNHYPEDIEATVQEITRGRVAAISVPLDSTEKLVTIIELKKRGDSNEEAMHWLSVRQKRRHLRDIQCARRECRRPRSGTARVDSHHDERQDPARRLCRAVPPGPIRPVGRLSRPLGAHPGIANVGHCPGDGRCRQRRTVPNRYDRAHAEQAQTGAATARVFVWRFRNGNDGGSGCPVRLSTQVAGVYLLHFAQGSDSDRAPDAIGRCRRGRGRPRAVGLAPGKIGDAGPTIAEAGIRCRSPESPVSASRCRRSTILPR